MTEVLDTSDGSSMACKWFKFDITEEIFEHLNDPVVTEIEQWDVLKKSCIVNLIEENPRSAVIFEFFFQIIQYVNCCESLRVKESKLLLLVLLKSLTCKN
jgi:hypothetical protein